MKYLRNKSLLCCNMATPRWTGFASVTLVRFIWISYAQKSSWIDKSSVSLIQRADRLYLANLSGSEVIIVFWYRVTSSAHFPYARNKSYYWSGQKSGNLQEFPKIFAVVCFVSSPSLVASTLIPTTSSTNGLRILLGIYCMNCVTFEISRPISM